MAIPRTESALEVLITLRKSCAFNVQHLFNKLDIIRISDPFTRSARFITPLIIANASLLTSRAVIRDNSYFDRDYVRVAVHNTFPSGFLPIPSRSPPRPWPLLQIAHFRYSDFHACAFYLR